MVRSIWHKHAVRWGVALGVLAVLVASGFVVGAAVRSAYADAVDGCKSVELGTATTNASGYALTANAYARYGIGGDFGTGYCGTMLASGQLTEPPNGPGGTLTVTLVFDTGSVTSTFTIPGASSSGFTVTEYTPKEGTSCGHASSTFTSTAGVSLTATSANVCPPPKPKK